MEAAIGFKVGTSFGKGRVIAYVKGGKTCTDGKYIVLVKKKEGRTNSIQMELNRSDIKTCHASNFIPVVEQIKEAGTLLYLKDIIFVSFASIFSQLYTCTPSYSQVSNPG